MEKKDYLPAHIQMTYSEVDTEWIDIRSLDVHPDFLENLAQLGIIELSNQKITPHHLSRIQKIERLRSALGVNLAGACIILELVERLDKLQQDLEDAKRR